MAKKTAARTIRTIADLADLPDDELAGCLNGLRQAIQAAKHLHANALADGTLPLDAPLGFVEYRWKPRPQAPSKWGDLYTPTTPVSELPVRPSVRHQLHDMRIFALEDLSAVSEHELRYRKDIGNTTVIRLRELLLAHGMDFAPHDNPEIAEYDRNRTLRRMDEKTLRESRAGLPDDAPITRLGLSNRTIDAAKRARLRTVGDLRAAPLIHLFGSFGTGGLKEAVLALNDTGQGLRCNPSPLELWRVGVLDRSELTRPEADDAPVTDLRPWLGAITQTLKRNGVTTLGALREAAKAGALRGISGIGTHGRTRVLEFLDMPGASAARKNRKAASARTPNSVFALDRDPPE